MKKKYILCLLLIIVCCTLVGCGSKTENDAEKGEEFYVVESYLDGIVKSDSRKYCGSLAKEVLNYLYADMDECIVSIGNMFDEIDAEYEGYDINEKKQLNNQDLEDLKRGLEEYYKVPSEKIEKAYRYSVDINATDYSHDEKLYIYVAIIDDQWWVVKKESR